MKSLELSERLLEFAARIGKMVDSLPRSRLARHIAGQVIRSGTSPAPNYEEACSAESRADFIHKLSICLKELRETRVWLRLIVRSELVLESKMEPLIVECGELANILGQSIVTAKASKKV